MSELDQQIAALRGMSSAQLREEWQRVWKEPAPRLGHDLLRRGMAWKLQERCTAVCLVRQPGSWSALPAWWSGEGRLASSEQQSPARGW
jgi:hypothetical protein